MDVSSKDSLQASRLGPVQSRSVLASSEQWGKVTRQSLFRRFSGYKVSRTTRGKYLKRQGEGEKSCLIFMKLKPLNVVSPYLPCPVCT